MLLGDLEAQEGNLAAAVDAWQRIESQNPAFLSLVAERLADAYRKLGDAAQALRVLKAYQQQYPSLDLLNTVFTLTLAEEGPDAAATLIKDELARNPTLLGLDRLLEAQLARRARRAPARPRARQAARRPAHQAARHVQVRALRLSRASVLLALPGLRQVGDVFADAHGDPGWLCLTRRVIVALDFANPMHALALADRLDPAACALKVGKEMFVVAGPEPVRWMVARGFRVFLDLKFHDIPNTVAQACAAATRLGVWMLNVHAAGGTAMMRGGAALRSTRQRQGREGAKPLLIAVTVLTSLGDADLARDGHRAMRAPQQALRLARLTAATAVSTASSARRSRRRRCARRSVRGSSW